MNNLDKAVQVLIAALKWTGVACLAAMMFVTGIDVLFRAMNQPLWGMVEAVSLLAVVVLGCAMPLTQRDRGHVVLDMILRRLPTKAMFYADAAGHMIGGVLFALVSWRCWIYANSLQEAGELTMNLEFPLHFVLRALSLAFTSLTIVLITDSLWSVRRAVRS